MERARLRQLHVGQGPQAPGGASGRGVAAIEKQVGKEICYKLKPPWEHGEFWLLQTPWEHGVLWVKIIHQEQIVLQIHLI